MYLGLDIGTSGIKTVLVDENQNIIAQADSSLQVNRPHPLWSEQNPADWWAATCDTLEQLAKSNPAEMAQVKAMGLAGQMHGATLLDDNGDVLRPAILWNDGRSAAECAELEAKEPNLRAISGNIAFPGFTAPKLLWVAKNEPEIFAKVAMVLLPKDYVRYLLTGQYIAEMSDAAGTLWLDTGARDWSEKLLAATGLTKAQMPRLVEGSAPAGILTDNLAAKFGMPKGVVLAGGAGDNAAGAIGIGVVEAGRAFLSLGTSGVIFLCNDKYSPNPDAAVHSFCHAIPNVWHQMSVMLNAASCLTWVTKLTGAKSEGALIAEIEATPKNDDSKLIFLPYLSGERTPHNDPNAMGVFFGMTPDTDRAALGRAVLEGVSFCFADGLDSMLSAGASIEQVSVIGGGSRSEFWGQMLADVLGYPLTYHEGGEVGPAYGGARLARLAITGENAADICTAPPVKNVVTPNADAKPYYQQRLERYRRLYTLLKPEFAR